MRTKRSNRPARPSAERIRAGRSGRAGFTLVEVMVAVTVLVIAIVGIVGSMLSAMALNRVNRETAIAQQAARRMLETVAGVEFRDCFEVFNTEAGDTEAGVDERGPSFVVAGLEPQLADADGVCGRIEFPVVEDGFGGANLQEDVVDVGLGMPFDLNGNNLIDNGADLSDTYRLLPVRVLVEWRGVTGNRSIELESMLSQR